MQVPNNYETDLIYPIIARAAEIANVNYSKADDRDKTYLKVYTYFRLDSLACRHFSCSYYLKFRRLGLPLNTMYVSGHPNMKAG